MADKIDVMTTDGPTFAAMLGLPGDWVAERQPRIADLWTWNVVGAIGDKVHAHRMSITGKEVMATHNERELRDLFHGRVLDLRAKLLEVGVSLRPARLYPPVPHAACDLCGCAVAAEWFRWDDPDAPCYGLACACNGCHNKVRNVTERLLGAARRLSLGAATELARRLEEGPPAPPRDQGHGAPRMDVGAVLGAVPLTRAGRTQEDTERNLGKLIAERGALQAQLRDVACALEPTGVPGDLDLVDAARWVATKLHAARATLNRLAEVQGHASIDLDGPKRSSEVADRTLRGAPAECHTPDACEAADACKAQDAVCVEDAAWRRWIVTRHGDKRMAYIREGTGSVGDVVQLDWPTKDGLSPAEGWVLVERTQRLVRGPRPHLRRGVEYPCEECNAVAGSTRDDRVFYRCNRCGYPGQ